MPHGVNALVGVRVLDFANSQDLSGVPEHVGWVPAVVVWNEPTRTAVVVSNEPTRTAVVVWNDDHRQQPTTTDHKTTRKEHCMSAL